jgi:hypothetical protein
MVSWLVGVLFAAWFLLTVLRNVPRWRLAFTRRDAARLIPDWALFARPRTEDMILLRRDLLRDGTLTRWQEVTVAGPRRWYNIAWNPELGPRRAFLSLASVITATAKRDRRELRQPAGGQGTATALTAMTSVPYLTVLRYLTERSHPAVEATQFMIVAIGDQAITGRYAPAGPGAIEFVSEMHRVPAPGEGLRR